MHLLCHRRVRLKVYLHNWLILPSSADLLPAHPDSTGLVLSRSVTGTPRQYWTCPQQICVTGTPRQYWTCAQQMLQAHPDSTGLVLSRCYRHTQTVLDLCSADVTGTPRQYWTCAQQMLQAHPDSTGLVLSRCYRHTQTVLDLSSTDLLLAHPDSTGLVLSRCYRHTQTVLDLCSADVTGTPRQYWTCPQQICCRHTQTVLDLSPADLLPAHPDSTGLVLTTRRPSQLHQSVLSTAQQFTFLGFLFNTSIGWSDRRITGSSGLVSVSPSFCISPVPLPVSWLRCRVLGSR